uniref:DUF5857 domain-containing protein n=1 Tax=viral metagenome TaxID=1070528 RepID=A0A6C0JSM9_9ZZZZ
MIQELSTASGTLAYDESGQQYVEDSMNQIMEGYSSVYEFTSDQTSARYDSFQYDLLNVCIDPSLPGVCDTFLTSYCSAYTRDQISNDSFLTAMCGCYATPDPTYLSYTTGTEECLDGLPGCQVCTGEDCYGQPACDPLCHRSLTVQKANKSIGSLIQCPQNICVIDESNASVNSDIPVNFTSVCTGCQEGDGCLCVVNTPSDLESNVFSLCGPDSVYLVNGVPSDAPTVQVSQSYSVTWGIVLTVVIALVGLLVYLGIKNGSQPRGLRGKGEKDY